MSMINNNPYNYYHSTGRHMPGLVPEERERLLEEQDNNPPTSPTPPPTTPKEPTPPTPPTPPATPTTPTTTTTTTTTKTSNGTTTSTSSAPTSTTPPPPANPNVPTPVYDKDVYLLPTNGDGTATITLNDGTTIQFEYPSFEDFFNDVVLKKFISEAQKVQKNFIPYRELNISYIGAPIAYVSMDKDNNIIITDDTVKDLCAYIEELIKDDALKVNETQEDGYGYNKYLTLLNISEEEARNMTPELAKKKLNEFYKTIGDGEKDADGNYKVSASKYYTYISECYFDPKFYNTELEGHASVEIHTPEGLTSMYASYCADKFNTEMKSYYNKNGYVGNYTAANKIYDAYDSLVVGNSWFEVEPFPDVVFTLLKDDKEGQKVAQMILKAAGVKSTDDEKTVRKLLTDFAKQFWVSRNDAATGTVDRYLINAYLNANGYNNPALYDSNFQVPEFLIPKYTGVDTPDSFDYTGLDRINENIFEVFNSHDDWKVLYSEVDSITPQMQDYIKEALAKSGKAYDSTSVERFLNYYVTQAITVATNKSVKCEGKRPETLEEIIENVKSQIDKELAKKDAFTIDSASELKKLIEGTHKNTLRWGADLVLKGTIAMANLDGKEPRYASDAYYRAYDYKAALQRIGYHSEYQALELKELYPQLTDEQISKIVGEKDDFIIEQWKSYQEKEGMVLLHWLVQDYRNLCLAEAEEIIANLTTDEPPVPEEPPVVNPPVSEPEPDIEGPIPSNPHPVEPPVEPSITGQPVTEPGVVGPIPSNPPPVTGTPPTTEPEPDVPAWKAEMLNVAEEKGYTATEVTGKYTYTDESGTSFVCIWDPIGQDFMLYVTASPKPEVEPEFTEDDKTVEPTVDGFYAEAVVAASKEGYETTKSPGLFEKDGKQYEYDIDKGEFIEYNLFALTYEEQFDENGYAIKKTLRNIYQEAVRKAYELGYSPTTRIGVYEKDGKQYKYDADDHKFVLIKTKEPETKPEEDES